MVSLGRPLKNYMGERDERSTKMTIDLPLHNGDRQQVKLVRLELTLTLPLSFPLHPCRLSLIPYIHTNGPIIKETANDSI
jgi:hypothetical protein